MEGFSSSALAMKWCILLVFLCFCCTAHAAEKCPRSFKISSKTVKMRHCKHLGELGAATLSWTYHPENGSADVAFKAHPASKEGWVAWGINPTGGEMVGTQALIAFRHSNGTVFAGTYNVTSKNSTPPAKALVLSNLSFPVTNLSSDYRHRHGTIAIYATLFLPSNKTMVRQVWQVGSAVQGSQPEVHAFDAANLKSFGTIDLLKGKILAIPRAAKLASPSPFPSPSKSNANSIVSWISLTLIILLTASAIFPTMV